MMRRAGIALSVLTLLLCVAALLPGQWAVKPAVTCGAMCDGLVAYWNTDEASGARADSVNGFTLTDNNTVGSAAGMHNLAASFVAANDESLSSGAVGWSANAWTISAWVKPNDANAAAVEVGDLWPLTVFGIDQTLTGGGVARFRGWMGDGSHHIAEYGEPAVVVSTGAWHLLIAWWDGSNVYISADNGTPEKSGDGMGAWVPSGTAIVNVGMSFATPEYTADGLIDEPAIWSRALTSGQITDLYNAGAGKFYNGFIFALYFREQPWRYARADWFYYVPQRPPLGLAALKLRSN